MAKSRYWVDFSRWRAMAPEQQTKLANWVESNGMELGLYMINPPARNLRLGDHEEFEGEADNRHMDHRGFNERDHGR